MASRDVAEHENHLKMVFERSQKFNFTLKLGKAQFNKSEVSFLGFRLSSAGIRPEPDKLRVISEFETPKNRT